MSVEKIKELNWQLDWVQIYADSNGQVLHFPYYPDAKAVFGAPLEPPFSIPKASIITLTQADLKELAEWWLTVKTEKV